MIKRFLHTRLLRNLAFYLLILSISACTTSYRPYDGTLSGGYSEMRLNPSIYRVEYRGGRRELLLYRCAELTRGKSYDSFAIIWAYEWSGTTVAVINLFHDHDMSRPQETHNAREILDQVGKDHQIEVRDFVPLATSSLEMGISEAANLPHIEIRLDENTFRLETSGTGGTALAKAVDHILLYRSAKLTSEYGGDYFVIMSGDGQYGQWSCGGFLKSHCIDVNYYDRSVVIRTFKGEKPTRFLTAFDAKSVLDNIHIDLPVQPANQIGAISEARDKGIREGRHKANLTSSEGVSKVIYCPTDGLWTDGLAKDQLEVGLLYRCAEQALREGYEYFVFEKEKENTRTWHDLIARPFDGAGYGGGPVFRGPYEKDRTMHGIWAKIRLVPAEAIADEPVAFHAREVLSYLGPVLKTMSEESTQ